MSRARLGGWLLIAGVAIAVGGGLVLALRPISDGPPHPSRTAATEDALHHGATSPPNPLRRAEDREASARHHPADGSTTARPDRLKQQPSATPDPVSHANDTTDAPPPGTSRSEWHTARQKVRLITQSVPRAAQRRAEVAADHHGTPDSLVAYGMRVGGVLRQAKNDPLVAEAAFRELRSCALDAAVETSDSHSPDRAPGGRQRRPEDATRDDRDVVIRSFCAESAAELAAHDPATFGARWQALKDALPDDVRDLISPAQQ